MPADIAPLRVGGKPPAQVLNIAHRGARGFAPENTVPAFEKAQQFGCPIFELDVHLSKDGELIVHHDDELTRCTDVAAKCPGRSSYFVSDFELDELRRLDAGSWFVREIDKPAEQRQSFLRTLSDEEKREFLSADDRKLYSSGQIKLPTLREALEVAQRTKMMVNVEIKTLPRMYPGIVEKVVRLVESVHMERDVLISSFDHEQLVTARRLSKAIAIAVLSGDRLSKVGDYLRLLDADAYNPGCTGGSDSLGIGSVSGKVDPVGIKSARDAGRGVNVWTCNDPKQIRQLIAAGVTGVFTDFPNRLRDVLAEL